MKYFLRYCIVIVLSTFGCFLNIAIAAPSSNFDVRAFETLPIYPDDTTFTMEIKVGLSECDISQSETRLGWFEDKAWWQFSKDEVRVGERYRINPVWDELDATARANGDEGTYREDSGGVAINQVFHVKLPIREKFQALSAANQGTVNKVLVILHSVRLQCLIGEDEERELFCSPMMPFNYFPLGRRIEAEVMEIEIEIETEIEIEIMEPVQTVKRLYCGLGWSPQSRYQHWSEISKVMIYALEFAYDPSAPIHDKYTCTAIEIRTGDDSITNLAGWNLYLGTRYNPSHIPLSIPEEHSEIRDRVLRLTPDMFGLETFPCNTAGGISHPLPGVHYVLKTNENVSVDTAYSCFIWGQTAVTTVNRVRVQSPRRISSARLREMETPRLERYIHNNKVLYFPYMAIEDFTWDRAVRSDWLLPANEETVVGTPNAPSLLQRNPVTTWGALKKQ